MNKEIVRLRKVWDILLMFSITIGVSLLLLNAFNKNRYLFELQYCKALTYLFIVVLFSRVFYRIFAGRMKLAKYVCVFVAGVLLTALIFLFNNALHFWGFASMFNYPSDVFYTPFCVDDIQYGIVRYVLFYVAGIISFVLIEEGIALKVCKLIGLIFDRVLELFGKIIEKMGLLRFLGLEYEISEDTSEDGYKHT